MIYLQLKHCCPHRLTTVQDALQSHRVLYLYGSALLQLHDGVLVFKQELIRISGKLKKLSMGME